MDQGTDARDLMARGRDLAVAGRFEEAEEALRECLRTVRGRGDGNESAACGSLGSLYGVMGRHFEAILLYRRGLAIGNDLSDHGLQVKHLSNIAAIFVALTLWEQAAHALAEFEIAVSALPGEEQEAAQDLAIWPHANLAIHLGQVDRAKGLIARFKQVNEGRDDALFVVTTATLEADLLRQEGDPEAALEVLDSVPAIDASAPLEGVYIRAVRMDILERLGRHDEAAAEALRLLDALQVDAPRAGVGELSIDLAMDAGACLARSPSHPFEAQRAYDLAASITLQRIRELDVCARAVPELSTLPDDDRAWISELRTLYRKQQQELLAHVADLLKEARGDEAAFLHAGGPDGSLVRICAWCSRVGTREGSWLPLAHYIPADQDIMVTHCICPECRAGDRLFS